jgi:hypothetical protein
LAEGLIHEDLRREGKVKRSSDRSFGFVFAVVFLLLGLAPLRHGLPMRWWALVLGLAFGLLALIAPRLLKPLNMIWAKVGDLMHKITSPLIMGILFFVVLMPFGVIMRAMGKDPLGLKRRPEAGSYWITRTPPGPAPDSLNQAF